MKPFSDNTMERIIEFVLIASAVACMSFVAYLGYVRTLNPPPEYALDKSEWVCAETRVSTKLFPMLVGKVTIMQNRVIEECVAYKRINND